MKNQIPLFLRERPPPGPPKFKSRRLRTSFLEKGIEHLAELTRWTHSHWDSATRNGFFQRMDGRIKILFLVFFVIIVSIKKDIPSEISIGFFILVLVFVSRLGILRFYKRVLLFGFIFGFLISLPSAFNLVTGGEMVFRLITLSRPYDLWIYHIPKEIGMTREGLLGVMMLTLRVINSISLVFLILYTTPFPEIIKALKIMKIPDGLLIMANLSYKYFFLLAKTVMDMHLAKKSRFLGEISHRRAWRWVAGRIAFIFVKTTVRSEEIFRAMLSRGFSDSIRIYRLGALNRWDWSAGLIFLLAGILFLWMGGG